MTAEYPLPPAEPILRDQAEEERASARRKGWMDARVRLLKAAEAVESYGYRVKIYVDVDPTKEQIND